MGFMDGIGRLLTGKPVFQEGDQNSDLTSEQQQTSGEKIVPRVCIIRSDCRVNDGTMEFTVHIKNESPIEVYLDNLRVFDTQFEIDRNIKPAQTSDFMVYKGPAMQDENRNKCELKYRTLEGDFFVMNHLLEYGYHNDTYMVDNVRAVGPVNDL